MASQPPQPAHWSKDFVEHLRTVHFTLIALCIGLTILASFPSKTEIQRAHDQVLEILKVTNEWDSNLIAKEIETFQRENIKAQNGDDFTIRNEGIFGNFALTTNKAGGEPPTLYTPVFPFMHDCTLKLDFPKELHDQVTLTAAVPVYEPPIRTEAANNQCPQNALVDKPPNLRLFALLWDDLLSTGEVTFPNIVKSCAAFRGSEGKVTRLECNIQPLSDYHDVFSHYVFFKFYTKLAPETILKQASGSEGCFMTVTNFEDSGSALTLIMPVSRFAHFPVDGQKLLVQRSSQWGQKYKLGFKDAFPELASVDGPFEDADIGSAERILGAEAKRTGDAFEAAGLKIPAEVAVQFGVLLIPGVQLYMLVHLREFGNRVDRDAGFEVAWIGVYVSRLARVMPFLSLLVLPAATILLLSVREFHMFQKQWLGWLIAVASNCASITLSTFIFRSLPERPSVSTPVEAD
jgi:hypothetical protein